MVSSKQGHQKMNLPTKILKPQTPISHHSFKLVANNNDWYQRKKRFKLYGMNIENNIKTLVPTGTSIKLGIGMVNTKLVW
jgi:hypothetical protein